MKTYFLPKTGSSAIITGSKMSLIVPYSTNLNSLSAEFYHTGKSSKVNGIEQISGQTANNYSQALTYNVTALNASQKNYTLSTAKGSPDSNTLFGFQFDSLTARGVITGTSVTLYVPFGTDVKNLVSTFSHNGSKVYFNNSEQVSGKTANNFTNPLLYEVQAENGSKKLYTIVVVSGTLTSNTIQNISVEGNTGFISGDSIYFNFPTSQNISSVSPIISHLGSSVTINGQPFVNGETTLDFTQPVKVKVTSADGSAKEYTIYSGFATGTSTGTSTGTTSPTIGGFVAGLSGTVVLQNNGGDNKTVTANGSFTFDTSISQGGSYIVTVLTNPVNQFCSITNGTGIANGSVTDIIVDCNNNPGTTVQSFTDLGNQTIRDNNTGLVWMKCTMSNVSGVPRGGSSCTTGTAGFIYAFCSTDNHNCNGGVSTLNLQPPPWIGGSTSSLWNACNNANSNPSGGFAGKTNWRVPTRDELTSLVDYSRTSAPTINETYFPNTVASNYWSSTTFAPNTINAWYVYFVNGSVFSNDKSNNYYVRCVSGP
ncbi:MAG: DUF1566 domain-containing protein [Leptospiraceae bacterium]|nr:DUF1566 domain-containing protein [Leptospiraceae bacterium]